MTVKHTLVLLVLVMQLYAAKSSITLGGSGVGVSCNKMFYGGLSLYWGAQYKNTSYLIEGTYAFRDLSQIEGGGLLVLKHITSKRSSLVLSPGISLGIWYAYDTPFYEIIHDPFTGKGTVHEWEGLQHREPTYFGGAILRLHWGRRLVRPYVSTRLYLGKGSALCGELGVDVNYSKRNKPRKHPHLFTIYAPLIRISPVFCQTREKYFAGISIEAGVLLKAQQVSLNGLISSSSIDGSEFLGITLSYGYRFFHEQFATVTPAFGISVTQTVANYYEDFNASKHRRYILSPSVTIELGNCLARPFIKSSLLVGQGIANVSQIGLSVDFSKL